jgi:hypothetical protein
MSAQAYLADLELRDCSLSARGVRAIGLCLALNMALTSVDIRGSVISEDNMKVCGDALLRNGLTKLGFVMCDCFMLQGQDTRLDLSGMRTLCESDGLSDDLHAMMTSGPACKCSPRRPFSPHNPHRSAPAARVRHVPDGRAPSQHRADGAHPELQ